MSDGTRDVAVLLHQRGHEPDDGVERLSLQITSELIPPQDGLAGLRFLHEGDDEDISIRVGRPIEIHSEYVREGGRANRRGVRPNVCQRRAP